jgi:nucleotide-binding universal stress UspA family protein
MDLSRVLAPVEFSDRCVAAARYAGAVARHTGAELTLLHVMAPAPPEISPEIYQQQIATQEDQLNRFLADDLQAIPVRRLTVKGDPARKIVQYAHNERISVILMATHGFGPFRHLLLGSNTAKVLHDADCPVWTGVHMEEQANSPFPPRHILCAVDLGAHSAHTIACAGSFRRRFHARLTILHATLAAPSVAKGPEVQWNVTVREAATKSLESLREESNVEADLLVETGDAPQVIASAAHRIGAALIVIGRGSASGVFGRLRANAYAVIRQAPCPVVSV